MSDLPDPEPIIREIPELNKGREDDIDYFTYNELAAMNIRRLQALLAYTKQLRGSGKR